MSWDSLEGAYRRLAEHPLPHQANYLGFYSSYLGGYFREPWGMTIPMDDHGFHRGDGVFEAVRIHKRAFYDFNSHLERLEKSASALGLKAPNSPDEIRQIVLKLGGLAQAETGVLRLYVTRGPGSFSPAPQDSSAAQLYAAITGLKPVSAERVKNGVRVMFSTVTAKDPFFSQIKSCNYLQNVLMKKECAEKGFDFAISLDGQGRICEGATENFAIVSEAGELIVPAFDYTLRGTTVRVAMELAKELAREGVIRGVRHADLHKSDLLRAREAAMISTTIGVLPIAAIDDKNLADSPRNPVFQRLREDLEKDAAENSSRRLAF